jgi:hypothetical protein
MTDVTGRTFLSYCRARSHEAELLVKAMREHGIPTWQDISNLEEGPTPQQLRTVLTDPATASALIWVTPEVNTSNYIRRIEVPSITQRAVKGDGFFAVVAAAGGLTYAEAAKAATENTGIDDLRLWNMHQIKTDPITAKEAADIARQILRWRIVEIHRRLPPDEPLRLRLHTWSPPPNILGDAWQIDWSHHFNGTRHAPPAAWDHVLWPALRKITQTIKVEAHGRRFIVCGKPTLSAAAALGSLLPAVSTVPLSFAQERPGAPTQEWSLGAVQEDSGFTCRVVDHDPGGHALAVLVSVADNVSRVFGNSRGLPTFRALARIEKEGALRHTVETPGQALDVALKVRDAIQQARQESIGVRSVHLFMAGPVGLAMLIGQLLNTVGPVTVYEHDDRNPPDMVGSYRYAVTLYAV